MTSWFAPFQEDPKPYQGTIEGYQAIGLLFLGFSCPVLNIPNFFPYVHLYYNRNGTYWLQQNEIPVKLPVGLFVD